METQVKRGKAVNSASKEAEALYKNLLQSWNDKDPQAFAGLFTENGNCVGFDGSQLDGRQAIKDELDRIFRGHQTALYTGIVKEVRVLDKNCAVVRAVAGMAPEGQKTINPQVNAIQSLIAVKENGEWRIALFQNTPAAFHERPELRSKLTRELQQALEAKGN